MNAAQRKAEYEQWLASEMEWQKYYDPIKAANPDGGNLYNPHMMMVNSGQFWRCAHGRTGFTYTPGCDGWPQWAGCEECRRANPQKAALLESSFEGGDGI